MQLKIKLKKRWITTVLNEADAVAPLLPWQRKRNGLTSSIYGANAPAKPRLVKA